MSMSTSTMMTACMLLLLGCSCALRPKFSWDMVANMTFFHSCNESGPFSEEALDTIQKFPLVTIEKGQGFHDDSKYKFVEDKIIEQLRAVKARDPSICTVFYMNSVLSWYFYEMNVVYTAHPEEWLYDSKTGKAVYGSGDKTFNPPKEGMLIFDHAKPSVREFWQQVCFNATATGVVDGCFSDSSQPGTHGTPNHMNASMNKAFEDGKVTTMSAITAKFGGKAGFPYGNSTGLLIGKKPDQQGINSYQIEQFAPSESAIEELMAGVKQGYLVQAHVEPGLMKCGCGDCMRDALAAFLIGAGTDSYFGTGAWIAADLTDVQMRWCPEWFEKPLGEPLADATRDASGVWRRSFKSGTNVTFDGKAGTIVFPGDPTPPPTPVSCSNVLPDTGIAGNDITPGFVPKHPLPSSDHTDNTAACCQRCVALGQCVAWTWYSGGEDKGECHLHSEGGKHNTSKNRISGVVRKGR